MVSNLTHSSGTVTSVANITGFANLTGGTTTINNGGVVGGTTTINGGDLTANASLQGLVVTTGTANLTGGTATSLTQAAGTVTSAANITGTANLNGGNTTITGIVGGTTTINNGTLSTANVNNSSVVTLGSTSTQGTLSYTGNSATCMSSLILGGAGGGRLDVTTPGQALTISSGNITGTGPLTIGGTGDTTIRSNLAHTGGLTKTDAGTLTLSGANTYTGNTTVNEGRMIMSRINSSGSSLNLSYSGTISIADDATLEMNATGAKDISFGNVTFTGSCTLQKTGTGWIGCGNSVGNVNVNLSAGSLIDVQAGTLSNGWGRGAWAANQSGLNVASGATFALQANDVVVDQLTGSGTVQSGLTGYSYSNTLTVGVAGGSGAFSGVIQNGGGTSVLTLVKSGAGTQTLSGTNTYSGITTINAGTLQATKAAALPQYATAAKVTIANAATLAVNYGGASDWTDTQIGSLLTNNGAGFASGSSLGFDTTNGSGTYGSNITVTNFGLTKTGANTLTLTGTNTYTGTTTVSNGNLLVNNTSGSGTGSGTVNVASGATLGGIGSVNGAVTVNGGILSPGASIESLTTGALTLNTGSTFEYEMNSKAASLVAADFQKVTGDLSLSGTVNLTLADLAVSPIAFAPNTTLSLINYAGEWNHGYFTYGMNQLTDGEVFTAGLNTWQISYGATTGGLNFATEYTPTSGSFVNLTAVPEPGSLFAIGCLIGSGALLRTRRRAA